MAFQPLRNALWLVRPRFVNRVVQKQAAAWKRESELRLGFVALTDCAPLVVAKELGFFGKYGLDVELRREIGWAAVRDKIIYGELDAAHALATMPFAMTLGLASLRCECVAGIVLNVHGNAITLSRELWDRGVRDARGLKRHIDRTRGGKIYTFGTVFHHSSHSFLLGEWLASGGINPVQDVRLVVVPPPSMFASLRAGNLDGYCVGEPWNTLAVQAGIGWCPATSAQLAPNHPEKVLMVRRDFVEDRAEEHARLVAALIEASAWCDQPHNREDLIGLLATPRYLNTAPEALRPALSGAFDPGTGHVDKDPHFLRFHGDGINEPTADKAAWILNHFLRSGAVTDRSILQLAVSGRVFRADVFDRALQLTTEKKLNESESNHETAPALI